MNRIQFTVMTAAAIVVFLPATAPAQETPTDTVRVGSSALHGAVLEEGTYVLANYRQTAVRELQRHLLGRSGHAPHRSRNSAGKRQRARVLVGGGRLGTQRAQGTAMAIASN